MFLLSKSSGDVEVAPPLPPPPTGLCRGWVSSGFFQPEALALVMAMKQWGLGLKGHICFWQHSIDLKFLNLMDPFVCFLNFAFVWNISVFSSHRSEFTLSQCGAQRKDIFLLVLHRKLMRAPLLRMCRNFRSIDWYQKAYVQISWDYPFKGIVS
jgi:hypothetical protein